MKSLADIAAQLQGYDPKALSAEAVNEFLSHLVSPVREAEACREGTRTVTTVPCGSAESMARSASMRAARSRMMARPIRP